MGVVIKDYANILINVPSFVRYGSRCIRDIEDDAGIAKKIAERLRSYSDVLNYPPNQVFIGNIVPDELNEMEKPWYENPIEGGKRTGPFGEVMPEDEFYGLMKIADDFDLLWLDEKFVEKIREKISNHPLVDSAEVEKIGSGVSKNKIRNALDDGSASPLFFENKLIGAMRSDHDRDDTLKSLVLLENLIAKASGYLAIRHLLRRANIDPLEIDFVLDCTETAIGDRYNRGGGSLSKAMAEMSGCLNATGHDVRAFCCSPTHAIISACGLVESGIFNKVLIAGGGCLAKVGMKYAAHLKNDMPILEDLLGGIAFLITKDDGESPKIRLDCIGTHDVGAGSSQEAIFRSLIVKPLEKVGLKITDIDKFSTELHNPEVTLPAGSGNTPLVNYRMMGALAVLRKEIDRTKIDYFVKKHGMPGFCPTQGHIPSAVPFVAHATKAMKNGELKKVMFVAKGSLFLGRMSQLSDGVSFLLEANNSTVNN